MVNKLVRSQNGIKLMTIWPFVKQNPHTGISIYFRKSNVLHGIEPMVNIIGVSKLKPVYFVPWLIFVVDFFERHYLRTEKIGQLCQVDSIA